MLVILPTSDVILETQGMHDLFCFYETGIKEAIEKVVSESDIRFDLEQIKEKLLWDYRNSTIAFSQHYSDCISSELCLEIALDYLLFVMSYLFSNFDFSCIYEKQLIGLFWKQNDLVLKYS